MEIKKQVGIIEYNENRGIQLEWEAGFSISVVGSENVVVIKANEAGLISLARHLMTLAQKGVPEGMHIHLDEINSLEENSCELIFEKKIFE